MSRQYDLPDGIGRGNGMRTFLVWGLPILAWVVIIAICWGLLASKDEEAAPPPPPAVVDTDPAPAAPPAQPEPAAERTESPAPTTASAPAADAPYDFRGAVSKLSLPHEADCETGILVDPATRKVLWAKKADSSVPIASMTKMMTMLLTEEAIAAGKVSPDTVIQVTKAAYEIGGSQVWLDPRESFPLSELVKTIAIKSANDSAYLVGEYLGGGNMDTFIKAMNERAKELGMKSTVFYDAHGLGDGQKRHNRSSSHDMVILAEHLIRFPDVLKLSATRTDTFREGKKRLDLRNSNNLVFNRVPGVDGLKTGYTKESGFCVTLTCERGGRRLIGCVTGFPNAKSRDAFCKALLDWGYKQ